MKNNFLTLVGRARVLQIALLLAVVIFATSCEKEDSAFYGEPEASAKAISQDAMLKSSNASGVSKTASIAEIAIGANFTQLVSALVYVDEELNAGLVDLFLNGKDQYTVFAPTDEAFEGLYAFLGIEKISDLPAQLVLDVLFYHVAEGRRTSKSVVPPVKTREITTLLGKSFTVNTKGEIMDIFGQTAKIVAPNISASNGIIHVIDTVILPLE
jgi:uncharacterized surface protein with fasciclin (FAS1) repeats